MKLSLRAKILGAFALIVLVSLSTAVGTATRLTRSRYIDFANTRDRGRARALSPLLGEWTARAAQLSESERPPLPDSAALLLFPAPNAMWMDRRADGRTENRDQAKPSPGRGRMMDGMMDRMEQMMPSPANQEYLDRIVITDIDGKVLADSAGYGRKALNPADFGGTPIRSDNRIVGYLYLGQMIPEIARTGEVQRFFRVAGYATWAITAFVFLFALLLGVLLTAHIVGPVNTLNSATKAIAGGNLKLRVPDKRRDELGDLSRGFNKMAAALESANHQRQRLIADSAHELRTPISLMRARIEMMEEGIYPMDRDGLAALSAETDRLTTLVEELRTLANLESPAFILRRDKLNLGTLIQDAFEAAKPSIDRHRISVDIQLPDDAMYVFGDREKLHQVMANLLNNAERYASGKISLSAVFVNMTSGAATTKPLPEDSIQISVEDDGPGIPDADLESVFDRFYRVDASRSRSTGGSGLGLAICREIIAAHGGRISAHRSETLGGAAIRIILPSA